MAWRINQIDQIFLHLRSWRCITIFNGLSSHHGKVERNGARLHGDTSKLLVGSGIQITDLASEFWRYDAIGAQQDVCERSLAMINVRQNTNIPYSFWRSL